MKKAYELTSIEAELIKGWREGKINLDGELWMKLSEKEREFILLLRLGKFGEITIKFMEGTPRISKMTLDFLHGNFAENISALSLLSRLQEI